MPGLALTGSNYLERHEGDRQRDCRLHRLWRDVNEAERSCGEGNAVRRREGGDGFDQFSSVRGNQNKREHEQEMIDTKENMPDAKFEIDKGDSPSHSARAESSPRASLALAARPILPRRGKRHGRAHLSWCRLDLQSSPPGQQADRSPTGAMSAPWRCPSSAK